MTVDLAFFQRELDADGNLYLDVFDDAEVDDTSLVHPASLGTGLRRINLGACP